MDPKSVLAIILVALFIWFQTSRDYEKGLCWSVFFLVWMPHAVRIEVPGAIPEFTIHRVILLVLMASGLAQGKFHNLRQRVPFFGLLLAMFLSYTVSMVFAMDSGMAFKRLFATVFESYLLYIAIACGSWDREHGRRLLKSGLLGILLIAVLAPLEYYKGLNVIGKFLPVASSADGVISTYEHSIHFGYATGLALPLAVVFASQAKRFSGSLFYFAGIGVLLVACYVSFSRGALWGGILAMGMVLAFGGPPLRKMGLILSAIVALALVLRPGVRETVFGMIDSTLVHDGEQDASAEYRKTLWVVAFTKTSESPLKLVFGLGGASTMLLDISSFFERKHGGQVMDQGFSSWDSQWASNLLQYGYLGLGLEIMIWLKTLRVMGGAWYPNRRAGTHLLVFGAIVGCAVWIWAMFTVAMFSPQLKYLVSTLMMSGLMLSAPETLSEQSAEGDGDGGADTHV